MQVLAPFITCWDISPSICDSIIAAWEEGEQYQGNIISPEGAAITETKAKISTDVELSTSDPLFLEYYLDHLQPCLNEYKELYSECVNTTSWGILQSANIQHYNPNEGFLKWHCERAGATLPGATRHLVFMTYLNDVEDGGGTEFKYQGVTVKAKKGRTLIWPADWTFTHRGITSPTQDKFIITGWFNFI